MIVPGTRTGENCGEAELMVGGWNGQACALCMDARFMYMYDWRA